MLRSALALWRGPAYSGLLEMEAVAAVASRLEERRMTVFVESMQLDLDGGRPADVVAALGELIAEHPYRERLRGLQMLALYRCGRQADALDEYQRTYQQLIGELGVEPGVELQRLQQRILSCDQSLMGPAPARTAVEVATAEVATTACLRAPSQAVPAQLPPDPCGFAGRSEQLAALDAALGPTAATDMPVAVVAGMAGVGKTALILHWAHRARTWFPDGQLYADLRGYSADRPAKPSEVLARFLRACGMPADRVPLDADEAEAAYRSLLADRRMLVVLDNASCASQIRPLLPAGRNCAVAVTSRDRLDGLAAREGARRIDLGVLRPAEVTALLVPVLGAERVGAEDTAVADLAALCAHLPLALRIAAATIVGERYDTIGAYVTRLRAGDRLTALSIDGDPDSVIRGAFDASYRSLPSAHQRIFRLLSLMPGADITAPGAAALAEVTSADATAALRRLTATHLVEERGPGRYAMHDLLRLYASECSSVRDSPGVRLQARERLLSWYLRTVAEASARLYATSGLPGGAAVSDHAFSSDLEAIAWLDAERVNLVAAITGSAEVELASFVWRLSKALHVYFWHTRYLADWLESAQSGLAAALAGGDQLAPATMRLNLGVVHTCLSRYDEALSLYTAAYESALSADWLLGQQLCLTNLGNLHIDTGELRAAQSCHRRSLALSRQDDRWQQQCASLTNLGIIDYQLGQLRRAEANHRGSLRLARMHGHAGREAVALQFLGFTRHALGDLTGAVAQLTRANDIHRSTGSRRGIGHTAMDLADLHHDAGRYDLAAELVEGALATVRETGDPQSEALVLNVRGRLRLRTHGVDGAVSDHTEALRAARRTRSQYAIAESLIGLSAALATSSSAEAIMHADAALAIADPAEFRLLAGRARTARAVAQAAAGDLGSAAKDAEAAIALHSDAGYRLGEAAALAALGMVLPDDSEDGQAALRAAHGIVTATGAAPAILTWPGLARAVARG